MPAIDLGPALDIILKFVPSIVSAASALITSIKQKRPAAEVAGDAADMLGDVAAVVVPTLPYPDGHPAREAVDLLPDVLAVVADGEVTRAEALAMGQRLLDTGADMLAWAGSLPDGGDEDGEEPRMAVKVAAAVKRTNRKAARRHARPMGQGRGPVKAAALAEGLVGRALPTVHPPAAAYADVAARFGGAWPHVLPTGRPTPGGIGDDANPNLDPSARPPRLGGGPGRPVDGVIGDGRGTTAPPVVEPVEEPAPPVVEPPVVGEGPPAGDSGGTLTRPLAGVERVILKMHADGLDAPGVDVFAWTMEGDTVAAGLFARGIPASWELTGREVGLIEGVRPGWLASLAMWGITVAPREPHIGEGTAAESAAALAAAGVAPTTYLGSCLDPVAYADGPWAIFGSMGGHQETKANPWSGVLELTSGQVVVGGGTKDSVAIKARIAREVLSGQRPYAIELLSFSGMDPKTGAKPWFATPWIHVGEEGEQGPTPILDALDRVIGEMGSARSAVLFTSYPEAVAAWKAGGKPAIYKVERS